MHPDKLDALLSELRVSDPAKAATAEGMTPRLALLAAPEGGASVPWDGPAGLT